MLFYLHPYIRKVWEFALDSRSELKVEKEMGGFKTSDKTQVHVSVSKPQNLTDFVSLSVKGIMPAFYYFEVELSYEWHGLCPLSNNALLLIRIMIMNMNSLASQILDWKGPNPWHANMLDTTAWSSLHDQVKRRYFRDISVDVYWIFSCDSAIICSILSTPVNCRVQLCCRPKEVCENSITPWNAGHRALVQQRLSKTSKWKTLALLALFCHMELTGCESY